jgi:hypothetical protein
MLPWNPNTRATAALAVFLDESARTAGHPPPLSAESSLHKIAAEAVP